MYHSHSSLKEYEQCPYKYYRKRVVKDVKDDSGYPLVYGNVVHKAFELYVLDENLTWQEAMEQGCAKCSTRQFRIEANFGNLEPIARHLRDMPGEKHAELKLGLTFEGEPTKFFAKDGGYLRGIIDLVIVRGTTAFVVDYKTGKNRGDLDQAERSAALVFAHYPEINKIFGRWLYVANGEQARFEFDRHDFEELMRATDRIADDIAYSEEHKAWPKQPTGLCGWCPVKDCPNWIDRG